MFVTETHGMLFENAQKLSNKQLTRTIHVVCKCYRAYILLQPFIIKPQQNHPGEDVLPCLLEKSTLIPP